MGSPDERQIDGMGGADPLTSKVAVVKKSDRPGIDVDYLFLQVFVDRPIVTDKQNCGNILAGIGPFAIERGLVAARDGETEVRIFMENTGQVAVATIQTPGGRVTYAGARASTACRARPPRCCSPSRTRPVPPAARCCRPAMRSTRSRVCRHHDRQRHALRGHEGIRHGHFGRGVAGRTRSQRGAARKLEAIRLKAGPLMNLGDVTEIPCPR
jgi:4-oxalomesaconate tautomerase